MSHSARHGSVHLVTRARPSLSDDIAYRQRRYLWMMGIRSACFGIAVVMFLNHLGWLVALPAVGAIVIPYIAVVFANGGREPSNTRGFMEYQPNLPVRGGTPAPGSAGAAGAAGPSGAAGTAGAAGVAGPGGAAGTAGGNGQSPSRPTAGDKPCLFIGQCGPGGAPNVKSAPELGR